MVWRLQIYTVNEEQDLPLENQMNSPSPYEAVFNKSVKMSITVQVDLHNLMYDLNTKDIGKLLNS